MVKKISTRLASKKSLVSEKWNLQMIKSRKSVKLTPLTNQNNYKKSY